MRTQIRITGYVVGSIWWPVGEECYKFFSYNVTDEECRWSEPGTLRDHVLAITNDGDFQGCKIADGTLEVTIYKPNRSRSRTFDLTLFPSISDCVKTDWCGVPSFDDDE